MTDTDTKKIAILGITGSIGSSACAVVRRHPDRFRIVLASAHNDSAKLQELGEEFHIPHLVLTHPEAQPFEPSLGVALSRGTSALFDTLNECGCDILLNAMPGSAGLMPSLWAAENGTRLALANKESLVMAGHLVMPAAKRSGAMIVPVDSEHSALFQAIGAHPGSEVKSLILTASGGPFRTLATEAFDSLTPEQTLRHPTWSMGAKVTVDSATMLNKGLETIEAHWLFDMPYGQIEALIHPQSIVHSLVRFRDGSILAQLSKPSMQLPILYAFTYPERIGSDLVDTTLTDFRNLSFEDIDPERFPLYFLAREAGIRGGLYPTVLNAAGEAVVRLFLQRKIRYTDMYRIVEKEMETCPNVDQPDLETVIRVTAEVIERVSNR